MMLKQTQKLKQKLAALQAKFKKFRWQKEKLEKQLFRNCLARWTKRVNVYKQSKNGYLRW